MAPRILYAADAAAALGAPDPGIETVTAGHEPAIVANHHDTDNTSQSHDPDRNDVSAQQQANTLVVIDGGLDNAETLIAELHARQGSDPSLEVLVIEADQHGATALRDALAQFDRRFESVHVLSHGNSHGFQLGSQFIDADSLRAQADVFAQWGLGLAENGDLLLYGCNLASSASGLSLIRDLAGLTGADIASSTNLTGAAVLGGDWRLEHESGAIESQSIAPLAWKGTLNLIPSAGETLVNSPGGAHFPADDSSGQIATNGTNTVVVFDRTDHIYFRIYGADDSGGPVLVDNDGSATRDQPAVAMNDNGEFVIVWTSDNGNGNKDIYAQRFAADGTAYASPSQPTGENWANAFEFRVNDATAGDQTDPAIAIRDDGSFLISWTTNRTAGFPSLSVVHRLFDADGFAVSGNDTFAHLDLSVAAQTQSRIAWDSINDRFALIYHESVGGDQAVNFREVRGDGSNGIRTEFSNPGGSGDVVSSDVAVRSDGRVALVIVYEAGARDLHGTDIDAFGGATTPTWRHIHGLPGPIDDRVSIALTDNDGALIVWEHEDSGSAADRNTVGALYDADWNALSGRVTLSQTTAGRQSEPSVAVSGRTAEVVWHGRGDEPGEVDTNGVYTRSLALSFPGVSIATPTGTVIQDNPAGSIPITVVLERQPTANVTINISSGGSSQATVDQTQLIFTTTDWSTPQTVNVTAVADGTIDGDANVQITLAPSSTDPLYSALATQVVDVSVQDTDQSIGALTDGDSSVNTIGEHAPVGAIVGISAQAIDPNAGDSVQYFIDDAASPFSVGLNDGIVRLSAADALDFETAPSQSVTIRAASSDGSSSSAAFVIAITDDNDPPTGGDSTITVQSGVAYTMSQSDVVFADVDGPASASSLRIDGVPGAGELRLNGTLLGLGSVVSRAELEAGLFVYTALATTSGTAADTFALTVFDDQGEGAVTPNTISVDANVQPNITSDGGGTTATIAVDENTTAVTQVAASDFDGPNLVYSISGGPDAAKFQIDAGTGVLRFVSAPNFELRDDADNDGIYDLHVRVDDSAGGSDTQTLSIAVRDIDEAFALTAPSQFATTEDTTLNTFDSLSFSDPESAAVIQMTLQVNHGVLGFGTSNGLSFVEGDGQSDERIVVAGSIANLNAALSGLEYTPAPNYEGPENLSLSLADPAKPSRVLTSDLRIDITAVNDTPLISGQRAFTLDAGRALNLTTDIVSAADVESDPASLIYRLEQQPDRAQLLVEGRELAIGDTFSQADLESGLVSFQSTAADDLDTKFTLSLSDADGAAVGGIEIAVDIVGATNTSESESSANAPSAVDGSDTSDPIEASLDSPGDNAEPPSLTGLDAPSASNNAPTDADPEAASAVPDEAPANGTETANLNLTNADRQFATTVGNRENAALSEINPALFNAVVFDSIGGDVSGSLAQPDRVWIEASMRETLKQTFEQSETFRPVEQIFDQRFVASSVAVSTGVSIGYVLWLIRGGALLSSIIATMPAWRSIDPLPILDTLGAGANETQDGESLESMLAASNADAESASAEAQDNRPSTTQSSV